MRYARLTLFVLLTWCASWYSWGGGSGLNTVVVVNPASSDSLALANYYAERHQVPPQNVFRLTNWTGSRVAWTLSDFTNRLVRPLHGALQARGLTQQVWQVVLSMDIPYRVDNPATGSDWNATTSSLFYGFKPYTVPPPGLPWSCSLPDASANSYAFSELPFLDATPDTARTNALLTFMLTSDTLAQAKAIVDRAVASDRSFPTQRVVLAKTTDPARNVRFYYFDDAIFDSRVIGNTGVTRTNSNAVSTFTNTLAIQTGLANFTVSPGTYVRGGMCDSLTSYAGAIFNPQGQTTLLAFLDAGAVASYGTVVEPCNYTEKFPHPLAYFYQARGFSIGESYYQSLANPFQGLLVGDPLVQPFARSAYLDMAELADGDVLSGVTPLYVYFAAADASRPVKQVDLFVDGLFYRTITNRAPTAGNLLSVTLRGQTVSYRVPANATVPGVAGGLASALNAVSNLTGVAAYPVGDRVELQGLRLTTPGSALTASASSSAGTGAQATTFVQPAQSAFLDSLANGLTSMAVSNSPLAGSWLRVTVVKTNGATYVFSVTNATGTTLGPLLQSLAVQINGTAALQSADGLIIEDSWSAEPSLPLVGFNVRARSAGWAASQIQFRWEGSERFVFLPAANNRLDENLSDLRPRNHLYVSTGRLTGNPAYALDTTVLSDGYHEFAVVAYEGSSVRTQTRVTRQVLIRNHPLVATLTTQVGGTVAALEGTLRFRVDAFWAPIASLELFSTGGSLGRSSGVVSTTFGVVASSLGEGLHPFYAVATDTFGHRYRTETTWIRIVKEQPPFSLTMTSSPLALSWPTIAARQYQLLATTNFSQPFQPVATMLAASNSIRLMIPDSGDGPTFYRVRTLP